MDAAAWRDGARRRQRGRVTTAVARHLPQRLAERAGAARPACPTTAPASSCAATNGRGCCACLTEYPLPWTGDEGYRTAEVTGGGVALDEVHRGTLESRRAPGLYFCGEVLDAFGPIGGHNFSWAWSTGRTAGRAAGA